MSKRKQFIRERFRTAVFARDCYKCVFCLWRLDLDAHHITDRKEMPNGGYVIENGITLCPKCHETAEMFHASGKQKWAEGFHPNDLYRVIGSSYEVAFAAAQKQV